MRREGAGERRPTRGSAAINTRISAETRVGLRVNRTPMTFSAFMTSFSDLP